MAPSSTPLIDTRNDKVRAFTNDVVRRMFVLTADDNYRLARIAFFNQLPFDFYWLSLHAIEKYYKAILLMNGHSAKEFQHDLITLHKRVFAVEPRLPFATLRNPHLKHAYWREESALEFLARLTRFGSPHNRYGTYGYVLLPDDLLKVDQHIWNVRRLCQPFIFYRQGTNGTAITIDNVEELIKKKTLWKLGGLPLEDLVESGMRHAGFLTLNIPFAPKRRHRLLQSFDMSRQPPMKDWFDILRGKGKHAHIESSAPAVLKWVLDNIKLSAADRKKIEHQLQQTPAP